MRVCRRNTKKQVGGDKVKYEYKYVFFLKKKTKHNNKKLWSGSLDNVLSSERMSLPEYSCLSSFLWTNLEAIWLQYTYNSKR